jgi:hydrogenase nickel incorporation protein HypA/HybF
MHELPITESILEIALRHARNAGATRIRNIYLVIGQLSTVVDESVQFYWGLVAEGTIAEGAQLQFRRIPAEIECQECKHRYPPAADDLGCPSCGSQIVRVVAGEEFFVEAIDVDSDDVTEEIDHAGAEA